MKSYSAYFVRSEAAEAARAVFGSAEAVPGSAWLLCRFDTDAGPPDDAVLEGQESLTETPSQTLGEVLFVYGDTSVDGFVYEHARNGELVRKLVWFPMLDDDWTAGWMCAAGRPEEWEATLFRPDALTSFLDLERQRYSDDGRDDEFPDYEAEIRAAWNTGQIVAGKTYPACDGTVALLVERNFGIVRPL